MLIIPLGLVRKLRDRPLLAAVAAVLFLYQAALLAMHPAMSIPTDSFLAANWREPLYYAEWALGLFRGAGLFTAILFFLFWIIFGRALEDRAPAAAIVGWFLAGAIIPGLLARQGWIAWEQHYWPGFGGMMAVLGYAYYVIWEEDVRIWYFILFGFRAGYSESPALFFLFLAHLILPFTQWVNYRALDGMDPPEALGTPTWTFLLPIVVVMMMLLARNVRRALGGSR